MTASGIVDVIVVLSLLAAFVGGAGRGFLRTIGGLAGVIAGAVAAYFAVPVVSEWVAADWRVPAVIVTAIVLLAAGFSIGEGIGRILGRGVDKIKLGFLDRAAGAVAGTAIAALVWVTITATVGLLGVPFLSTSLASSTVIRTIDSLTPDPVRSLLAQARAGVVDGGSAWLVEALDGPTTAPSIPDLDTDSPQVETALASVVKITGIAYRCGTGVSGSGFVVAPDRIVTNAHVVAGVDEPVVEAPGLAPEAGRVVYVDTVNDLAVIATDGLDAAALPLDDEVLPGDDGVVAGYPFGGPMTVGSASVVSDATLPLTIGGATITREVLTLAAEVNQGNSGGPLLSLDGTVSGVIFGKGTTVANVGFAIPLSELAPVAAEATSLTQAVDTGACAAG